MSRPSVLSLASLARLAFPCSAVVVLLGCQPPEGRFACIEADECPLGWSCVEGYCRSRPAPDVGPMDASVDSGIDAPGADTPERDVPAIDALVPDVGEDACLGATDDPDRCGSCATVCPEVVNGSRTCVSSACDATCDEPWERVASPTGAAPRCSQFGGVFVTASASACPTPNPFTGTCTCPEGFEDRDMIGWGGSEAASGTRIHVCEVPLPVMPEDAWGGVFARNEVTVTCPSGNRANGGTCSCGTGFSPAAQIHGLNSADERVVVTFCRRGPAVTPSATFATAFTRVTEASTDCVTGTCIGGAAACACPTGSHEEVAEGPARRVGDAICAAESVICVPDF